MKFPKTTQLETGLSALLLAASTLVTLPASAQTDDYGDESGSDAYGEETPSAEFADVEESNPTEPSTEETLSEESTDPEPAAEPEPEASEPEEVAVAEGAEESETDAVPAARKPFIGFAPPLNPAHIENETLSLRLGVFAQPQLEVTGAPDANKSSKNLFLRNIGVIVSGRLFDYFEYFFDVNYPNLFKVDPTNQTGGTGKNAPGLNVQDAIVTFMPFGKKDYKNALKFDAGFMLPPTSHNAVQGAFTLYGWDHFINAFRRNVLTQADPFRSTGQSPQGRDAGVQVRGLVLGDHLEYRVGLFQGLRVGLVPASTEEPAEVGAVNFFRMAARVQVNFLDAEDKFFYQGTYLGEKKILSIGGFYDFQDQYVSAGGDALVDLPLGPGVLTAQANVMFWDGGNFIQTLPKHLAIMAEAGYIIRPLMLSPIVRMEYLKPAEPTAASPREERYGGGLAFWGWGHNANLKGFYTYVIRDPAPKPFHQVNLQAQLYF